MGVIRCKHRGLYTGGGFGGTQLGPNVATRGEGIYNPGERTYCIEGKYDVATGEDGRQTM